MVDGAHFSGLGEHAYAYGILSRSILRNAVRWRAFDYNHRTRIAQLSAT